MAWLDTLGSLTTGLSNIGTAVLGFQTQKANLETQRAQLKAVQAAPVGAPPPTATQPPTPEKSTSVGDIFANPMVMVGVAVLFVVGLIFAMRK